MVLANAAPIDGQLSEGSLPSRTAVRSVILVVSFGTSYAQSRMRSIGAIEHDVRERFWPAFEVRRAFTSRIIVEILRTRDGIEIDSPESALRRCIADGVRQVLVVPTHLTCGFEYEKLCTVLREFEEQFDSLVSTPPLFTHKEDYAGIAQAILRNAEIASEQEVSCGKDIPAHQRAFCLVGHGTSHEANEVYSDLAALYTRLGYANVFVGTVEARPNCADVIAALTTSGFRQATLVPLMIVAGDHAHNDIADGRNPESWVSQFRIAGIDARVVMSGLGEYEDIRALYCTRVEQALRCLSGEIGEL